MPTQYSLALIPVSDSKPTERVLRLLLKLLRRPYRYTRTQLAEQLEVDRQSVKRYIATLRRVGLEVDQDSHHRYAVFPSVGQAELKKLQPLTNDELDLVVQAVTLASTRKGMAEVLTRKLKSLRDFQQLGLRALRTPELAKIGGLEEAISDQVCARLVDYRSTNSNSVAPRLVEPFELDTANGIVHAYDLARRDIRHFRLDRFVRVEVLDEPATHQDKHRVVRTDPFRIAMDEQVRVHLELDVAARNDLTERFPATLAYLSEAAVEDTWDFDAQVNAELYGVLPYCMANWRGVRVLAPEELRAAMRAAAKEILTK